MISEGLNTQHAYVRRAVRATPLLERVFLLLVYVSIFFNSITLFTSPFEFYIGYLAYLLLPIYLVKYPFPAVLAVIFGLLLITGVANILFDNNSVGLFLKIFVGTLSAYLFYYYFIINREFDLHTLFRWYLRGCVWVSVLAWVQFVSYLIGFEPGYNYGWLLNKWAVIKGGAFGIRVNTIFGEPSQMGAFLGAACFVAFLNLTRRKKYELSKFESILVLSAAYLTYSAMGNAGLLLGLVLVIFTSKFLRLAIIGVPILVVGFNYLVENVHEFGSRYYSTIGVFTSGEFEIGETHGSSIILYNNFHIALENLKQHPLFGTGFGSHPFAFEKYSLTKGIAVGGFDLNSMDANSQFIRLLSETGIFGASVMVFILLRFYTPRKTFVENDDEYWIISNACLVLVLLNLMRQGHYFINGFPFFLWLYIFSNLLHNKRIKVAGTVKG